MTVSKIEKLLKLLTFANTKFQLQEQLLTQKT